MRKLSWASFWFLLFSFKAYHSMPKCWGMTQELVGRFGLGMSHQLANNLPAFSFKLQRSPSFAFGTLLAFNNSDRDGGMGAGIRLYRTLFDEPLLHFYTAGTLAYLTSKRGNSSSSGFQMDLSLGSEFHFAGIESLGFSFEFGVSLRKLFDELTVETIGQHLIQAGVHFYL